ncbi:MAG: fumarylacetoacetate hydrolase family protein [Actinomycetia bacterium]|nr:fumarylacetoacetate hydrolase family protein [Actinomycetes bacterium]
MRLANLIGRATIVVDGRAIDVHRASDGELSADPMMMCDLANHSALRGLALNATASDWPLLEPAQLGAPVPRPGKGFGVALNYRQHALESGRPLPTEPHLFGKSQNCVVGPFDEIIVPVGCESVDYEAELVIVFGRTCKNVQRDDAWSVLAGVTCGQDVSDRAEQHRPPVKQFTIAKSYDSFGPVGPYLVTQDDLANRDALPMQCRIGGEVLQTTNTSDLIFDVPALVEWVTRYITFEPGDLLWTGTPGGVGEARNPQRFLRAGDVVETDIEGIGCMRNPVVSR